MKIKQNKAFLIESVLFFFVFGCVWLITAFVSPKVDEYIFSTSTELNFGSIFSYTLNYGNGRLLGNIICIVFSHLFEFRSVIISFVMASIVFVLYRIYFNKKVEALIPIAVLVLFMPRSMFSSVLLDFPSFINYVVPLLLFLIAYALLNDRLQIKSTVMKFVLIMVVGVAICLFSENTTGIVFLAAVLFMVICFLNTKKIDAKSSAFLFATVVGSIVMLAIPEIMGVEEKLDSYHAFTLSLTDIFGNLMFAADIINDFVLLFIIISLGLGYMTVKMKKIDTVNCVCMTVMGGYTVFSLLIFSHTVNNTFVRLINLFFTVTFCIATAVLIIRTAEKEKSLSKLTWLVLAAASVGPMTLVNILSYRTFYITYVMLLLLALDVLYDCFKACTLKTVADKRKRHICTAVLAGFMVMFSVMQFEMQLEGFCTYVIKNENVVNASSVDFEDKFGYGLNPGIFDFALENKKYFAPDESKIWPDENCLDALK